MKHNLNYVSIPIDKGYISLKTKPRAVPWTSSSRNEQAYINYYNSFIELTLQIIVKGLDMSGKKDVNISLLKPHNCIIEKLDGSFSFIDPQTNQEMGIDISENIMNESFYRAVLDCCFCNKEKQLLDDYCPCYNGMSNFYNNEKESDVFKSIIEKVPYENTSTNGGIITWKVRVPMRLLSGFCARNAFLLTRNFVTKLYFNEFKYFIDKITYNNAPSIYDSSNTTNLIDDFIVRNMDFYYDQTICSADEEPFDPILLNIPSTKIERAYTNVICNDTSEKRVKFTDTLNFSPKFVVMFFTNEKDDLVDLVKISPKYLKISTGGETNINPSFDPDSTNEEPDYRLWSMTKQSLDLNNQPCLNYDIWKNASRFYIFSFAENFSLLENNNYINYEIRFNPQHNDQKINIHRVYLKDYLSVFESNE